MTAATETGCRLRSIDGRIALEFEIDSVVSQLVYPTSQSLDRPLGADVRGRVQAEHLADGQFPPRDPQLQ